MSPREKAIEILYEDEYLIAVNKPANVLSIPDSFREEVPNVYGLMRANLDELFINHRLDKETSGVLLFSKTAKTHKAMSELWQKGGVSKFYNALVNGIPPNEGVVDVPIMILDGGRRAKAHKRQGKVSKTGFRVLESLGQFSLLELELFTGRLHQIRVHMLYIGHPLMIDRLYGTREAFFLSEFKAKYNFKRWENERPLISRLSLHACALSFEHPFTGHEIRIEAQMPKDLKATINQLKKIF
tara:strand:+ start:4088 stop:4813 length:726 start_codon:yes stop_codon:yes gene_type:complete